MNGMSEYEFYKAQKDELLKQQMDTKDQRITALEAQLVAKEKENLKLEKFAAEAINRQVELEMERTEYKHKLEYTEKHLNAAYAVIRDLEDYIAGKTISIGDANRAELVRVLKEQGYIKEIE